MFEDQKIDKMDSTSCHDPQIAKYRKLFFLFNWIDFKYKKVHIHRIKKMKINATINAT